MKRLSYLLVLVAACTPTTQPTPPPSASDGAPVGQWQESPTPERPVHAGRFAAPPTAVRDREPLARDSSADVPNGGRLARDEGPARKSAAPAEAERSAPRAAPAESKGDWGEARSSTGARGSSGGGGGVGDLAQDAARQRAEPTPEVRPGLATSWGETRYSSVTEVAFERDGSRPTYTTSMNYNDARGAAGLAGRGSYAVAASVSLGGALTLSLRDEWGNTLSAYRGSGRTVAVGEHGRRYTMVVQNHTNERFEVVLSVDGLDVLDGQDAGYGKRGYLIDPYAVVEIEGFRQSEEAVAAFRFGSVSDSYAAQTGSARNVGVIGAAAFGERGYAARLRAYQDRVLALRNSGYEIQRRQSADPFPNGYAVPPLRLAR